MSTYHEPVLNRIPFFAARARWGDLNMLLPAGPRWSPLARFRVWLVRRRLERDARRRRAECQSRGGHQLTRRAWVNATNGEVGEYHVGCTHCTLFWTETPSFTHKMAPRYMFLEDAGPEIPYRGPEVIHGP